MLSRSHCVQSQIERFRDVDRHLHEMMLNPGRRKLIKMHMSDYRSYEGRRRRYGGVLFGLLLALILGAVLLGMLLHRAHTGLAGRLAALLTGRTASYNAMPDVVEQVRRLHRLETVVYSLDTVVENKESNPILPDVLAGDKLLMIVHGQTIAGIDFSKLKAEDVQMTNSPQGRTISLTLRTSEVFLTTIDNAKTRVYARDTGLFVAADPRLESATREKAQGELQQAALSEGILDAARDNARETVRAMLQGLGSTTVEVR